MLVAISIPIFTSQLEKSRDAVTISNLRAAYAEASTEVLTSNVTSVDKDVVFKGKNNESGTDKTKAFSGLANELPFTLDNSVMAADGTAATKKITFTFASDGTVSAAISPTP